MIADATQEARRRWVAEEHATLRVRVDSAIGGFLDDRGALLTGMSPELAPAMDLLRGLLTGGKRIRPAFCYWGWRAAGGQRDAPGIIAAAASLEMLHASALIHDDYIDGSSTRRGAPAIHRAFAERHTAHGWSGSAERFGGAAAILLGDLCLTWSDELLDDCGLSPDRISATKPLYHLMRSEVMAGQYLDVLAQARGLRGPEASCRAHEIIRLKSAKYTVERPLQVGARLAGGEQDLMRTCTDYGVPLGEAFQLRDDVLGVFGDPATTGKPSGDDLREGKQTVLVTLAAERSSPAGAALLRSRLGDPTLSAGDAKDLAEVIRASGALDEVERRITELTARAVAALEASRVSGPARDALRDLAVAASSRAH